MTYLGHTITIKIIPTRFGVLYSSNIDDEPKLADVAFESKQKCIDDAKMTIDYWED